MNKGVPSKLEGPGLTNELDPAARLTARRNTASVPPLSFERAERDLMRHIFDQCHDHIVGAAADSHVLPEFLAALTANESGGNAQARRFEPGVFEHLKAVAEGRARQFEAIRASDLTQAEHAVEAIKSPEYHSRFLNTVFAAKHALSMAEMHEDSLRAFASSWGFTQVMGYHVIGHKGSLEDLCDPRTHYVYAIGLLNEFIHQFRLDSEKDFESLFRCWNSGSPRGQTFDPAYVPKGLRRSAIYKEVMAEQKTSVLAADAGTRPSSQGSANLKVSRPKNP
jgi:hypothetical protein